MNTLGLAVEAIGRRAMKKLFLLALIIIPFCSAGCQQLTPTPVPTAPPVTSTAYSQITNSPGVTATTYTDLPAPGTFCYFVQMLDGKGVSAASNVACATTTTSLLHIVLTWSAASGYTCVNAPCTYMVSRAPATLTLVGVPSMSNPTNTAMIEPNKDLFLINLKVSSR